MLVLGSLAPAAALAGTARRAHADAAAGSAARQEIAGTLLEHTARGERARIARELHDVVAHHVSMVAVQAESARLAVPGMPAAGAERLSAIGDTARAALTEMRRLLGVLREDTEAERRPQPGLTLEELIELVGESRDASGSATRLILSGTPVPLDPGVELAAYRIAQEALTNARRHAPRRRGRRGTALRRRRPAPPCPRQRRHAPHRPGRRFRPGRHARARHRRRRRPPSWPRRGRRIPGGSPPTTRGDGMKATAFPVKRRRPESTT
ncbi:sensor histidine kinase [Nonomuraea ferruginea]